MLSDRFTLTGAHTLNADSRCGGFPITVCVGITAHFNDARVDIWVGVVTVKLGAARSNTIPVAIMVFADRTAVVGDVVTVLVDVVTTDLTSVGIGGGVVVIGILPVTVCTNTPAVSVVVYTVNGRTQTKTCGVTGAVSHTFRIKALLTTGGGPVVNSTVTVIIDPVTGLYGVGVDGVVVGRAVLPGASGADTPTIIVFIDTGLYPDGAGVDTSGEACIAADAGGAGALTGEDTGGVMTGPSLRCVGLETSVRGT